jgi:antitoxin HicB
MSHAYTALLASEPEGGFTASFPEVGIGATYAATRDEALRQAEDMLEEAVLGLIAHGEEVPEPQIDMALADVSRRPVIVLPVLTAAKLELYRAMRAAGLDRAQLAQRLDWADKKVAHIFDGYHKVSLQELEAALAALGRRLVVSSEPQ